MGEVANRVAVSSFRRKEQRVTIRHLTAKSTRGAMFNFNHAQKTHKHLEDPEGLSWREQIKHVRQVVRPRKGETDGAEVHALQCLQHHVEPSSVGVPILTLHLMWQLFELPCGSQRSQKGPKPLSC